MANKIRLAFAGGDYEIIRALKEGSVEADGIELVVLTAHGPRERHWRMARNLEYDVCEFNVGAYFMARARNVAITAIPVFLHRRFRHGFAFVNVKSGIKTPKDLIGKRVGGTNFQPAGNIWLRGILEEHYGVPHKSITWVVDRSEDVEFTPPPGLKIEMIPPDKSMDTMLAEGEIPAMINPYIPRPIVSGDERVTRLFPDYKEVEIDYYKRTKIFPIMHVLVIRKDVYERHPWVARSLYKAFCEAKDRAIETMHISNAHACTLPWLSWEREQLRAIFGPDWWPYGIDPNRHVLETLIRYLGAQGLLKRPLTVEEIFAPSSLGEFKL